MESIGSYLRARLAVETVSDEVLRARLSVPSDLQGPPGIAHGGAVAALLLEAAGRHARDGGGLAAGLPRPLLLDVTLARAVPLDAPLAASAERRDDGSYASRIARLGGATLAEARIGRAPSAPRAAGAPRPAPHARVERVPGTTMCLACGLGNPRGLSLRLDHDASFLWKRLAAPAAWREADGSISAALPLVLLDEIGWWLGAMACRECGLSTRLVVTLGDRAAAETPLLVAGARAASVSDDPRGRVWRSRAALLADADPARPIADAEIAFAGGPAFTKSMAADLFDPADREAASRLFPTASIPAAGNGL